MSVIVTDSRFLNNAKLTAIVRDQTENYQRSLPLRYLDRTPVVDADDEEIQGSYTGTILAADLVMNDQAAVVYDTGAFEFTTTAIPNFKIGQRVNQSKMQLLRRLERGNAVERDEVGIFDNWQVRIGRDLRQGVDERVNAVICAMQLDLYTYDRLGIKLNVNWGMPANLKVTPSTLWTNTAATPITDILVQKEFAQTTYGENYDRITMSKADFRLAIATDQFKAYLPGVIGQPIAATAYSPYDDRNQGWFAQMIGMDIEFEDKQFSEQTPAGVVQTSRVHPLGKILLSTKSDDNNSAAMAFGNAIVDETVVSSIVGGNNTLGDMSYGPIAYWEGGLNPPNLIAFAVRRGFPIKRRKTCTSVLTVRA